MGSYFVEDGWKRRTVEAKEGLTCCDDGKLEKPTKSLREVDIRSY